ncbi:MAG: c-type cytochrome [Chitinophagaceae bacterium]|nr:MAG: c-type cytochrome [Chitinophagaceae bacterium]
MGDDYWLSLSAKGKKSEIYCEMNIWTIRIKIAVFATGFLLFISVVFASVLILNNNTSAGDPPCYSVVPQFICGTLSLDSTSQNGKNLFNETCAACHKRDVKSTGPALRNVEAGIFWTWLDTTKHKNDSLDFEKMGIDFHRNLSEKQLTATELKFIYNYLD